MSRRKDGTAMWYDSDLKKMQDNNMGEKFCFDYNPYKEYKYKLEDHKRERISRDTEQSR